MTFDTGYPLFLGAGAACLIVSLVLWWLLRLAQDDDISPEVTSTIAFFILFLPIGTFIVTYSIVRRSNDH